MKEICRLSRSRPVETNACETVQPQNTDLVLVFAKSTDIALSLAFCKSTSPLRIEAVYKFSLYPSADTSIWIQQLLSPSCTEIWNGLTVKFIVLSQEIISICCCVHSWRTENGVPEHTAREVDVLPPSWFHHREGEFWRTASDLRKLGKFLPMIPGRQQATSTSKVFTELQPEPTSS